MKTEGLKRCLDCLSLNDLDVDCIITDPCPKVQTFLREQNIAQFYSILTFERGLFQKLDRLSHQTDCTVLKSWLRTIKNHLYWSVESSASRPERVAKWTSLINHMQNIHQHQNPLYPTCAHAEVKSKQSQKWLQQGSHALNQVKEILNNEQMLEDIAKLSPHLQTYSVEAFHNLIKEFTPKNLVFTVTGMLCRSYLAAMHHNENADLDKKRRDFPALSGKASKDMVKRVTTYNYLDDLMNVIYSKILHLL